MRAPRYTLRACLPGVIRVARATLALGPLLAFATSGCTPSAAATVPPEHDSIAAGQSPVSPVPVHAGALAGRVSVAVDRAVLATRTDGTRVVQLTVTATNVSNAGESLDPAHFTLDLDSVPFAPATTLRETTLLPGQFVTGTVAFALLSTATVSTRATLRGSVTGSSPWSAPFVLALADPADPSVPGLRVGLVESLRARWRGGAYTVVTTSASTMREYRSGWMARVDVTVTNTGRESLSVTRAQFHAAIDGNALDDLFASPPATATRQYFYRQNFLTCTAGHPFPESTTLAPGESVSGNVCWEGAPRDPAPGSMVLRFAPDAGDPFVTALALAAR